MFLSETFDMSIEIEQIIVITAINIVSNRFNTDTVNISVLCKLINQLQM